MLPELVQRGSKQTIDDATKALADLKPGNPAYQRAFDARDRAWRKLGEPEKAREACEAEILKQPNNANAHFRLAWTREEVDERLHSIMRSIHSACLSAAEEFGHPGDYAAGANIAGFRKVADAMIDQGVV